MANPAPAPAPSRPILAFFAQLLQLAIQELPGILPFLLAPAQPAVAPAAGNDSGAVTLARKPCCGDTAAAPDLNAMAAAVQSTVGVYVASATQLAVDQNALASLQTALATDTSNVSAAQSNALAALSSLQAALSA